MAGSVARLRILEHANISKFDIHIHIVMYLTCISIYYIRTFSYCQLLNLQTCSS